MKSLAIMVSAFALVFFGITSTANALSPMACPEIWQPVCGAQQVQCVRAPCYPQYKTYSNSCMLSTDQGAFIHEGECTASETGPYTGGDSDTYIPPAGCMAWFDGCNSCSRSTKDGPAMCTMMACQGTPQAGYCRTYETPAPPTGGDTPVSSDGGTVSSPPAPAPETPAVVATGTTPEPEKQEIEALLAQLWSYILSLFSLTF